MTTRTRYVGSRLARALVGLVLLAGASGVRAQPVRDPTLPPSFASGAPAPGQTVRPPAPEAAPVAVIVRDGRPYLVVGTRLYGQGQMLGDARIERITETEVWLRDGKVLRKRPVFAGIERRTAGAVPAVPPCIPVDKKNRPATRVPPSEICPP